MKCLLHCRTVTVHCRKLVAFSHYTFCSHHNKQHASLSSGLHSRELNHLIMGTLLTNGCLLTSQE